MKGFVQMSVCVLLLLAGLAVSTPVGDCPPADPEDFHMPDDSDCTVFYKCAHGVPVKFDCPAPLHFNSKISVCDWPENAGCAAGSGPSTGNPDPPTCECTCPSPSTTTTAAPDTTTTAAPVTTTTPVATTTAAPDTTSPAATTTAAPDTTTTAATPTRTTPTRPTTVATTPAVCDAVGTCPQYDENSNVVHLPHRSKCDVYCRCNHGVPIEMPCAPGTWFNAALQVCDWPAASGCVEGQGPTEPPVNTETTAAPPVTTEAPPVTTADPPATTARPLCDAVGVCPIYDQYSIVKHLPHRTRCDVYCRCDHGAPLEMPCPVGTYFNAALEVCDWPLASGCTPSGARVQGKLRA